ncbi:MAG: hypothetical protein WBE83_09235 [Candidatus Cybelea sp.]|jgi:hypothetical protein
MTAGPLPPARNDRATTARGNLAGSQAVAAQRQAFDFEAAEHAEILREHEILEALLMAHLKNEDEITKKWISLI